MLKRVLAVTAVALCSVGIVLAAPVNGTITKIDGNKITVMVKSKANKEGEAKTYEAAANVKVSKSSKVDKKETKVEVPGGLKAEALQNLGKGVAATLEVDGDKVTEIVLKGKAVK